MTQTDTRLAKEYLETRWDEQALLFPVMRVQVPKNCYVKANLRYVLANKVRMELLRGERSNIA